MTKVENELLKLVELCQSAMALSADQVSVLEQSVLDNALDLDARMQLVAYYHGQSYQNPEVRDHRIKHVAWIVDNQPGYRGAGIIDTMNVTRGVDSLRSYVDVRRRWLRQIDAHPGDCAILSNAAEFFFLEEMNIAEWCLREASKLQPTNANWPERLARLYHLSGTGFEVDALKQFERHLELNPSNTLVSAVYLAELALGAGDLDKATSAALEVLNSFQQTKDYDSTQKAHTTLGRIALREGNIEDAVSHLLKSQSVRNETNEVSRLDAQLAVELYAAGERKALLQWIDLCQRCEEAVRWRERLIDGTSPWTLPDQRRYFELSRMSRIAYNGQQWQKAKNVAEEFIAISAQYKNEPRHQGFGLHTAYVVLGQLALRERDIGTARQFLDHSTNVPEAQMLMELGPDMGLAADFATRGETPAVLDFLKSCRRLWHNAEGTALLQEWVMQIERGKLPAEWDLWLDTGYRVNQATT